MNIRCLILFLSLTFVLQGQSNCDEYSKDYKPLNLKGAIQYLDCLWSESDKNNFKNKPEEDAVTEMHFGAGMGIRNAWELWNSEASLSKYFQEIGVSHPDDMSSIILTSFHRFLNEKEIDLENQVKKSVEFYTKIESDTKTFLDIAISNYSKYETGDLFSIYLEVDTSYIFEGTGEKKITWHMSADPNYVWSYNPDKDIRITGELISKRIINDSINIEFSFITKEIINIYNVDGFWGQVGDSVKTGIIYMKIE